MAFPTAPNIRLGCAVVIGRRDQRRSNADLDQHDRVNDRAAATLAVEGHDGIILRAFREYFGGPFEAIAFAASSVMQRGWSTIL